MEGRESLAPPSHVTISPPLLLAQPISAKGVARTASPAHEGAGLEESHLEEAESLAPPLLA